MEKAECTLIVFFWKSMDRKLAGLTFAAIAINFFLWNVLMPVFEPADESGHYAHTLYIMD